MNYFIRKVILTTLTIFAGVCTAASLDEKTVVGILQTLDQAVLDKNIQPFENLISPNADIKVYLGGPKGEVKKFSKKEYIDALKQGWQNPQDYTYKRTSIKTRFSDDKRKAFIKSTVKESLTVKGQTVASTSEEEMTIELVNDTFVITKMIAIAL